MQAFASACGIGALPLLTELELWDNRIGDAGLRALVTNGAHGTPGLEVLLLVGNRIGPEGAEAIAQSLTINSSLTSLNLHYNEIEDSGADVCRQCLGWSTSPDRGPRVARTSADCE